MLWPHQLEDARPDPRAPFAGLVLAADRALYNRRPEPAVLIGATPSEPVAA